MCRSENVLVIQIAFDINIKYSHCLDRKCPRTRDIGKGVSRGGGVPGYHDTYIACGHHTK